MLNPADINQEKPMLYARSVNNNVRTEIKHTEKFILYLLPRKTERRPRLLCRYVPYAYTMGECDDDLSGSGGSSAGTTNRRGMEGNGRYRLMKSWRRRFGHHWPFVRKLSGEFLSQRTGNTELWYCVVSLSKLLDKVYLSVMWDVLMLMWRHFNGWVWGLW